jgi:hypothetical protein
MPCKVQGQAQVVFAQHGSADRSMHRNQQLLAQQRIAGHRLCRDLWGVLMLRAALCGCKVEQLLEKLQECLWNIHRRGFSSVRSQRQNPFFSD